MTTARLLFVCARCREEYASPPIPDGQPLCAWLLGTLEATTRLPWPLPLSLLCPGCGYVSPVSRWTMTVGVTDAPEELP